LWKKPPEISGFTDKILLMELQATPGKSNRLASGSEGYGFLGQLAGGIFKVFSRVATEIDSLPLDQKYVYKQALVALFYKIDPKNNFTDLLLKDDWDLASVLQDSNWWVLPKDITGPVKRQLLLLGQQKDCATAVDTYLCNLFRENEFNRLHEKTEKWQKLMYLQKRRTIILDCLHAHKEGKYTLTVPSLCGSNERRTVNSAERTVSRLRKI
jgi:hypothetical protein